MTCDTGYYCLGGTSEPVACQEGFTSDTGASECYYAVTINTNNDENITETLKCEGDNGCTLPSVTTKRSGYVATGKYCTAPDGTGTCYDANVMYDLTEFTPDTTLYIDYRPVYLITLANVNSDEFKKAPLPQPYSFWLMYGTKWCADSECTVELTKLSEIPEFVGYDFAGVRTNAVTWGDTTANDIVDANGNFITDTAALTTTIADASAAVQWNRGITYCEPGSYYAGHSTLSPCTRCVQSGITKGKYCPGGEFNTDYAPVYDGIAECPDGGTTSVYNATLADCHKTETRSDIGNATMVTTCYIDENNQYTKDCVSGGITACNPGYYIANSGDTECSPVGYGYYSTRQTERQQCIRDRIYGLTPTTETETASAESECYVTNDSGNKCYYMSAYSKYYCY